MSKSILIKPYIYPKFDKNLHQLVVNLKWFISARFIYAGLGYKYIDKQAKLFTLSPDHELKDIIVLIKPKPFK